MLNGRITLLLLDVLTSTAAEAWSISYTSDCCVTMNPNLGDQGDIQYGYRNFQKV